LKQTLSELNFETMDLEAQLASREAKAKDYQALSDKFGQVVDVCNE